MTVEVHKITLEKTPRREARESYVRFLLKRASVDDEDAEKFLNERQNVLFNNSPLELIYTGQYEQAVTAVEIFVESLTLEDL